jgi:hypothetical protein
VKSLVNSISSIVALLVLLCLFIFIFALLGLCHYLRITTFCWGVFSDVYCKLL